VRNRFLKFWFGFGYVFEKLIRFGMSLVRFGSKRMRFGSDVIVIYYSCNSWAVNLQQILQWQQMTWLWHHWHHSQQRQKVNNVIAFYNLYAKLCFGHVLKRSLSAHLMPVNLTFSHFLFEWRIACSLYRKSVGTDVKVLEGSVFENWIRTEFRFFAHPYTKAGWLIALIFEFRRFLIAASDHFM